MTQTQLSPEDQKRIVREVTMELWLRVHWDGPDGETDAEKRYRLSKVIVSLTHG